MRGHPFQIFALMYLVSGQWSLTAGQWALAVAVLVVLAVACGVGAWLIASKAVPWATGAKARTRVDVYAPAMGHGEAVEKVTRQRAEAMASRLIEADHWRKGHVAGISAGAQHRGQHVDVHQLGGHGYRSGGPTFRQIPVLRDPGRALGTGPVPGDLEQGRHPRRDRPDPQARPSERRNMDVRPRTHRGPGTGRARRGCGT